MTPLQTRQFKAMAETIVAQAEQINRLTETSLRLIEAVEKLQAYSPKASMMLPEVPA